MLFGMFDFHTRETPPSSEELALAISGTLKVRATTSIEAETSPGGIFSSKYLVWISPLSC
jgi:hypothetical protein